MKRVVVTALTASAIALFVFACDDGFDSYGDGYGYGYAPSDCERHASCGSCTPVEGCGWCSSSDGQSGTCTSSPDRCNGSSFGWTWEPSGCRVPAEASVGVSDGGAVIDSGEAPEGSPTDSAIGTPDDAANPSDTGTSTDPDAQTSSDDAAPN